MESEDDPESIMTDMTEQENIQQTEEEKAEASEALEKLVARSPEETAQYIRELRAESAKWRNALREAEKRLKGYEEAERQRAEQEAVQRGEWQQLAEQARKELEATKREVERLSVYEAKVNELLKERLKKIPEGMRARVPKFDNPLMTLEWLEANADLFTPKAPSLDQSGLVGQKPRVDESKVRGFITGVF